MTVAGTVAAPTSHVDPDIPTRLPCFRCGGGDGEHFVNRRVTGQVPGTGIHHGSPPVYEVQCGHRAVRHLT